MRYETKLLLRTGESLHPILISKSEILIDQDITDSDELISNYISWLEEWNDTKVIKTKKGPNLALSCITGKFNLLNPWYDLKLKKLKIIY
jgi:hypothetical protein